MKKSHLVALATFLTIGSAASAETIKLSEQHAAQMSRAIEARGLNCPIISAMTRVPDNVRGKIVRIDCQGTDKRSSWSIRWVAEPPGNRDDYFEPW